MASDYEIPPYGSNSDRILSWCLGSALSEGEAWLQAQRPSVGWEAALQALSGPDEDAGAAGTSELQYKRAKRTAREMVASLAQFRHYGEFKVTWNQQLYDTANMLTRLDENWYRTCRVHEAHRAAIQFAVATGTAYLWETWDPYYHSRNRGDIKLQALSPQHVMFVQLPSDHDIQKAYAVIIREELPINLARAIYSRTNRAFADGLVPDRDKPSWIKKGLQKVQQFLSPALRVGGRMSQQESSFPTVDIFHMYTLDQSVNDGPMAVTMGTPGTNWTYRVPALGDPIPTGVRDRQGNELTRPATDDDCRLFPLRRYTIFSRTGTGYDGSSPWWHGQAPLARLRFGDWAWESLGSSQVTDILSMEKGMVALMRLMENSHACRLNPGMMYDDTLVSGSWAQAVQPNVPGSRASAPLMQGDPIKPILPPEYYNVPGNIDGWIEGLEARMDYISGVRDLVAIAKAKQIPGADALEKLMEMAGPIVQDLVRAIEEPLSFLGELRKAYYFQFYTRARMISTQGMDGVPVNEVFVPEKLVPTVQGEALEVTRARAYGMLEEFTYEVTQSGINEINRTSQKLLYIQLVKALDFPISPWTMAKICQIPNFGPEPENTNTEMERWIAWQRMKMELQVDLAKDLQAAQAEMGMVAPQGAAAPTGPVASPAQGGQQGAGRPPSFNAPPKIVQKDGGTRSTITTS